ncbi:hypothetical protein LEP1GSC038_1860 [Leptospira weilii str. 2006001855]|uniref:Uncharacterized protein n=1 Tax=Leptospira weilii str. 2006001855 TaxID=996804 RepID=M6FRG0_9LEPT|nr:hypothetical protein LEP1GSC038_1860 [Leptospira weilii str. 2006001855]
MCLSFPYFWVAENKLYFALYGSRNRWKDSGDFSISENHTLCK